jgi:SanA protein
MKFKKNWRRPLLLCLVLVITIAIITALANTWVWYTTQSAIFTPSQIATKQQVGIVLGAKVYADGRLSGMTQDRCDTAINLYQQGKIEKILISGDHGQAEYDEVNTMKDYLLSHNIPAEHIFLDHAGFDTYDSIYRAKAIFQAESAIIITQQFHLPRAVFIAQQLGLPAIGAVADIKDYGHMERVIIREKIAVMKAWFNILLQAKPTYLGDVIPLIGDSKRSWDE